MVFASTILIKQIQIQSATIKPNQNTIKPIKLKQAQSAPNQSNHPNQQINAINPINPINTIIANQTDSTKSEPINRIKPKHATSKPITSNLYQINPIK